MSTKICHISTVHKANDDRIFHKECVTLAENGYEVYFVVQNFEDEIKNGVHIVRLPEFKTRLARFLRGNVLALVKALRTRSEVYHFHDPELMFVGVLLRISGAKVIYDVHEDVPEQILSKSWLGNKLLRKVISVIYRMVERFCSLFYTKFFVVTPSIAKQFPSKRTTLLRNMPIRKMIDPSRASEETSTNRIIIYSGGLTEIRGIIYLVKALEFLPENIELRLLGTWEDDRYKEKCIKEKGWQKVNYIGQVEMSEVYSHMKLAEIGLVNFLPLPNHINALPNKPFEYMACSLPMVMSDFHSWKEYFDECALFANPSDPSDIAKRIEQLLGDASLSKVMGDIGRKLIQTEFSWEVEQKKLLDVYKALI